VGWLFYLGTLLPVIGLVQVGLQARADRYTYVPLIGIFLIFSWGIAELTSNFPRRLLGTCALATILLALMLGSWRELRYWHDSLALWNHALEVTENNYLAHCNRGYYFLHQNRLDLAEVDFRDSIRIWTGMAEPQNGLGFVLLQREQHTAAEPFFRAALAIRPTYPEAHNNLGICLLRQGKSDQAIAQFQEALRWRPNWPVVQNNLRIALSTSQQSSKK
jgi:tetratricopeptide (TPR) repeat protein